MNYRMVLYNLGRILLVVAVAMVIPWFVAIYYGERSHWAFPLPILISFAAGIALTVKPPQNKSIYVREGLVVVSLAWFIISIIGALPFYISGAIPSFVDCFFETVSGFTTTGATILSNVEGLSKSLLFWRSFTHWLGGMGVLVLATAIFSTKSTRTTYVMKAEMPGPGADKLVSKWQFSIRILYTIYTALTVIETVLLVMGGMPLFDSILHAFGTAGTGGFGTKNSSVAFYNSAYIDYVIGIFMVLFAANFSIYYLLLMRRYRQAAVNDEIKWYIGIVLSVTLIIAFNIMSTYGSFEQAFRYSFFQVASIMSTTGYSTTDFATWPALSQSLLVAVMFIGGCVGSTGGGFKVKRFVVLVKTAVCEIKRTISPRSVQSVKMDGKSLEPSMVSGILGYFVVYALLIIVSVLIVSMDNMDLTTTFTAVMATVNNIGPGLGAVGPMGNFGDFSVLSKIVMSIGMLAGRLEIYPVLVLALPYTWKRS